MARIFHKDGSSPRENQVFVFGSNMAGMHLGGAARAAYDFYGAEWGIDCGPTGRSFAIPTMSRSMAPLPLGEIRKSVEAFLLYAAESPEQQYFITRLGCGIAGYADADIAPMFRAAPVNCSLPDAWQALIDVDDSWIDRRYSDDAIEPESIIATMRNIKALSDAILNDQEVACTRS